MDIVFGTVFANIERRELSYPVVYGRDWFLFTMA